jgi:hypothetical protein
VNTIRYFIGLLLVISLPPLFLYWLLIHPFVNFWRTKGIDMTYGVVLTIIGMGMIGLFSIRHHLLTNDYGANYTLIVLGVVCLVPKTLEASCQW